MERGIKENTHPGEILKEEIINANELSITEVAGLLKVSRPTLSNIVNSKAAITPNMALRISKVFGGTASIWVRLQASYDLREAELEFSKNKMDFNKFVYA